MGPPLGVTASAHREDLRREGTTGQSCRDVESMIRLVRSSPAVAELNLGQKRLGRIVRAFLASDAPDLVGWIVSYADPTGETAVRNVLRDRGQ